MSFTKPDVNYLSAKERTTLLVIHFGFQNSTTDVIGTCKRNEGILDPQCS